MKFFIRYAVRKPGAIGYPQEINGTAEGNEAMEALEAFRLARPEWEFVTPRECVKIDDEPAQTA